MRNTIRRLVRWARARFDGSRPPVPPSPRQGTCPPAGPPYRVVITAHGIDLVAVER
ncbi:hypothetical protein [Streptomyces sp. NPDC037389]|uniref:hypothetical protein n=1 Tax=Streptomyces sp. NPDC037389 TaxID=3155369 RepID=UPI0033D7EBCB